MATLHIPISSEAQGRLARRAAASGEDLPAYVARLVRHFADPPTPVEELSGPIYQAFLDSGMSDDELGELLEKAKHEMRAQRRANRP
ncbi:MAG: hypothetical protein WD042_11965 [Phycisphaeraceae bacterium]